MKRATILPGYWYDCQTVNAETAIFHQWEQLVASGSIDNFHIAAGESDGFREGWFFADSDAFKWLDAAARIYATHPSQRLADLMDDFIALIGRAQMPDGYIYTYNQIHFADTRWVNLQIEHELYCHGHLIEAGVSHHESTGRSDLLNIACKGADRIVEDFKEKGPKFTPGHQEIEIALLRLYQTTQQTDYLEMARQFIEQRGCNVGFGLSIFQQNASADQRKKMIVEQRQTYMNTHADFIPFQVPAGNEAKKPWNIEQRMMLNAISGKYFQQHAPVRKQTTPVGHSVRFAYLETAIAMLTLESGDKSLLEPLERIWDRMVSRRMYITGGIGSLPTLEGFGNDYELDPEFAYAETCAALGNMFWNWEMTQLTNKAQYADLFEWQLYNASRVGMGAEGTTYFYNNPLACRGGVTRKAWYEIPCCPSNISRTWADIGKYLYSHDEKNIWVHQYVDSEMVLAEGGPAKIKVQSGLPWQGKVVIQVTPQESGEFSLHLRIPSWARSTGLRINNEEQTTPTAKRINTQQTASGFDPRTSTYQEIKRNWSPGDVVEIDFNMDIQIRRAHPKVKGHNGKAAITAGPLVFCLESVDNPEMDIFNVQISPDSLALQFDANLLGGTNLITAKSQEGTLLTLIPYHLWGNRGASQMTVWMNG
ncbi:MAG: glycoside hydrolase family 127 protein [Anaerolineaceae bacterium]|nr:glycoside hydrolase family 127 protein [Anaerolineaceae bacterium]